MRACTRSSSAGCFRLVPDRVEAYEAAKLLNALLFALAAVPFYLLARRLLAPWPSVALAGLAVAIPSAVYVSLVMTESLAYLAFAWALYAIVLALERPTLWRQLAVLLAIVIAAAARTEFIALFGAYVAGLFVVTFMVPGRWARPARLLRTLLPTVVATLAGVVAFVAIPAIEGEPPSALGGYSTLWRRYDAARSPTGSSTTSRTSSCISPSSRSRWRRSSSPPLYRRARAGSERDAAFLALFVTVNAALLLIVAAFNSTIWAGTGCTTGRSSTSFRSGSCSCSSGLRTGHRGRSRPPPSARARPCCSRSSSRGRSSRGRSP